MNDNDTIDEETALLAHAKKDYRPTPLPKVQIGIVLLLHFCGNVANRSISPYIIQLISELDITGGDKRKVGYYAGLLQSLYYLAEIIMVMQWSRVSDHVGRKPVLLIGLVGVIKSMIGELTNPSNRARGFSMILVVGAAGTALGPLMGGAFARPHDQFPRVFGGQFWQDYPYFLPCLVTTSVICVSFIITLLFLNEVLLALMPIHPLPHEPLPLRDLLVYPVIISISNYMALAFLRAMFDALLPLFLAMPIHIGGLGFKPSTIGYIMGYSGINLVVWFIIVVLLSLTIFVDVAYSCIFIYVTASSPNKRSLGATNGLSQMGASLARAVGSVLATSLFSLSVEKNLLGGYAVYAILFCISCLAMFLAVLLPEKMWEEKDDDNND
ncbi:major facilitator superfamily domain-containing protein [Infundibulicybe gibba]|nr:major facilitator superfamily domain-containing protein [Infundibulicybe gibba]